MKAQERHKLKTNELAESLREIPEYLRKYGRQFITGGVIVVVVVLAGLWFSHSRAQARQTRLDQLQILIRDQGQMQVLAARQAQIEPDADTGQYGMGFDTEPLVTSLQALSENAAGTPVGMTALIRQAQALRSQLLFSDQPIADQEKEDLCDKARGIYQRLLNDYPHNATVVGLARMGLGLNAEDRRDWATAREIYEGIVADADGKLAGTIAPSQAQQRLRLLDRIDLPIEFPAAPLVEPTSEPDLAPSELGADLPTEMPITLEPVEPSN